MSNIRQKRKLQMMEYPKVNTIKQYDNFHNNTVITVPRKRIARKVSKKSKAVERRKIRIRGIDAMRVIVISLYAVVFLMVSMLKMKVTYEVTNLGTEKVKAEKKLSEIKLEVEALENTYISNYDLKKVEQKSKDLGFVHNDTIEYVKLKDIK